MHCFSVKHYHGYFRCRSLSHFLLCTCYTSFIPVQYQSQIYPINVRACKFMISSATERSRGDGSQSAVHAISCQCSWSIYYLAIQIIASLVPLRQRCSYVLSLLWAYVQIASSIRTTYLPVATIMYYSQLVLVLLATCALDKLQVDSDSIPEKRTGYTPVSSLYVASQHRLQRCHASCSQLASQLTNCSQTSRSILASYCLPQDKLQVNFIPKQQTGCVDQLASTSSTTAYTGGS